MVNSFVWAQRWTLRFGQERAICVTSSRLSPTELAIPFTRLTLFLPSFQIYPLSLHLAHRITMIFFPSVLVTHILHRSHFRATVQPTETGFATSCLPSPGIVVSFRNYFHPYRHCSSQRESFIQHFHGPSEPESSRWFNHAFNHAVRLRRSAPPPLRGI